MAILFSRRPVQATAFSPDWCNPGLGIINRNNQFKLNRNNGIEQQLIAAWLVLDLN